MPVHSGRIKTINKILQDNKGLNFVQRFQNPESYPVINNPDGSYSTHRMSYGTSDNGAFVYPDIIQEASGNLKELSRRDAMNYAREKKEFIPFKSPEVASWFTEHYKETRSPDLQKALLADALRKRIMSQ